MRENTKAKGEKSGGWEHQGKKENRAPRDTNRMEDNQARVNTKEKGEEHDGENGKSGGATTPREKGKNRERGNFKGKGEN